MKSLTATWILCFLLQFALAQTKFGVRASYGICNANMEEQFFVSPDNKIEYKLSFMEHRSSKAFGLFVQKKIGFIYLQPEFMYRSTEVDFELVEYFSRDYTPHLMKEEYHYFHVPITGGMHYKNIRFGAGPVFNYLLDFKSGLQEMDKITEKLPSLSYGFQIGFGYDYKMFYVDLKYEFAFSKIGEHVYYTEARQSFKNNPNLLNLSIGIAF